MSVVYFDFVLSARGYVVSQGWPMEIEQIYDRKMILKEAVCTGMW